MSKQPTRTHQSAVRYGAVREVENLRHDASDDGHCRTCTWRPFQGLMYVIRQITSEAEIWDKRTGVRRAILEVHMLSRLAYGPYKFHQTLPTQQQGSAKEIHARIRRDSRNISNTCAAICTGVIPGR